MEINCEHPVIIQRKDLYDRLLEYRNVFLGHYSKHIDYMLLKIIEDSMSKSRYISMFSKSKLGVNLDNVDNFYLFDTETGRTCPMFYVVPCGKCVICRQKKISEMSFRALCETQTSKSLPVFLTLTYDNENVPKVNLCGTEYLTLVKSDLQKFIKRLRERFERVLEHGCRIRYMACGEYGSKTLRPHYHILLWNSPFVDDWKKFVSEIESCWTFGFVCVRPCRDSEGSRYICKYMLKRPEWLCEVQEKPFFLSSRRRGIGYEWVSDHIEELRNSPYVSEVTIKDKFSGKCFSRCLPRYFRDLIWPSLSRIVPKEIRDGFFEFTTLARTLCYERWVSNDNYYDDLHDSVMRVAYKYEWLAGVNSSFVRDFELICTQPPIVPKRLRSDLVVKMSNNYRELYARFCDLEQILTNIELPLDTIRNFKNLREIYATHFGIINASKPVDVKNTTARIQKEIDLSIQREKL